MLDQIANMSTLEALSIFAPRMIVATLVGGFVGLERELRNKTVGLKTNVLICTGSALFTTVAALSPGGDPNRVAAQIVSGIGFLGAGAIFKAHDRVRGLTTAAFIWVVAAFGVLIGNGGYTISIILSLGMVMTIEILTFLEDKFLYQKDKSKAPQ